MNRLSTLMLATMATLFLSTSACKKGNDSVQPDNNTPIFVGKNLTMTSFEVNPAIDYDGDGQIDTDLMVFLRPCDRDNTILFEKNGKMSGNNGALSCSLDGTDSSVVKTSTWSYNEQTKTIRIVKDNDATDVAEWKVIEASASSLKVDVSVNEASRSYKTTMTLTSI